MPYIFPISLFVHTFLFFPIFPPKKSYSLKKECDVWHIVVFTKCVFTISEMDLIISKRGHANAIVKNLLF